MSRVNRVLAFCFLLWMTVEILLGLPRLSVELLLLFLFGWVASAQRWSVAWHPAPTGLVLFIFALVLLIAGTHAFAKWLYPSLRKEASPRSPALWTWKLTLCGFGILGCALLSIGCLILTTHQFYWIVKSGDPPIVNSRRDLYVASFVPSRLVETAEEKEWDTREIQRAFWKLETWDHRLAAEDLDPLWVEQDAHTLRAVILIPRHPLIRWLAHFSLIEPGNKCKLQPLDALPRVLVGFGLEAPATSAPAKTLRKP